jgi:hypothetical protein
MMNQLSCLVNQLLSAADISCNVMVLVNIQHVMAAAISAFHACCRIMGAGRRDGVRLRRQRALPRAGHDGAVDGARLQPGRWAGLCEVHGDDGSTTSIGEANPILRR